MILFLPAQRPTQATNSQANMAVVGPLLCRLDLALPFSSIAECKHLGGADVPIEDNSITSQNNVLHVVSCWGRSPCVRHTQ